MKLRMPQKPLLIGMALLILAVGLLLFMNYAKFASTLENRERARHLIVARDLAQTLESQLALGLELEASATIQTVFRRELQYDERLRAIVVLDNDGLQHITAVSVENPDDPQTAPARLALWQAARKAAESNQTIHEQDNIGALALGLRNSFGVNSNWLVLEYDLTSIHAQTNAAFHDLWPTALGALAIAILILFLMPQIAYALREQQTQDTGVTTSEEEQQRRASQRKTAFRRFGLLLAALLLMVQCAISWQAYHSFTRVSTTDVPRLAASFTHTIIPEVERALFYGIPLEKLRGVEEWLQLSFEAGKEFAQVKIENVAGQTLFQACNSNTQSSGGLKAASAQALSCDKSLSNSAQHSSYRFPIFLSGQSVGTVVVTIDLGTLQERTRQLMIEFATLLVIGVLLSMELLHGLLMKKQHQEPDQSNHLHLRLPLFLFFISSELPRAFLPMWGKQLAAQPLPNMWEGTMLATLFSPFAHLPPSVLSTLPFSLFLFSIAVVSPFAGRRSARRGPVQLMYWGLLIALLGNTLALFANSMLMLCLARALIGMSSGLLTVAAFDYIGRSGTRARGVATYLAAYVAAGICGSGLGALLVDRTGTHVVFATAIVCTLLAALAVRQIPKQNHSSSIPAPLAGAFKQLIRQPRFIALLLLVGLPMQLIQQGVLFYWAPLALTEQGEPTSFVGLTMMLYFFLVLIINAPAARWTDRNNRHAAIVLAGLVLAGVAALLSGLLYTSLSIAVSIALIGVLWAVCFPAQGALILRLGEEDLAGVAPAEAIGVFRMIERFGAMLASPLIACMAAAIGYANTATSIGVLLLTCAALQGLMLLRSEHRRGVRT